MPWIDVGRRQKECDKRMAARFAGVNVAVCWLLPCKIILFAKVCLVGAERSQATEQKDREQEEKK